jgi:hypothetical protein
MPSVIGDGVSSHVLDRKGTGLCGSNGTRPRTRPIGDHRIDFADVPAVFNGPMLIELDDRQDYGEERWIGLGLL